MEPNQVQGEKTVEERIAAATTPQPQAAEVKEEQPSPTPSENQNPTETPQPETVDEEAEALANSKNPERTKAYIEKLKNKLKEAEKPVVSESPAKDYGSSVFDSFRPAPQQPQPQPPQVPQGNLNYLNPLQVENIKNQFVDQNGNVDIDGLNRALIASNESARRAQAEAHRVREEMARFEENQQAKEAHAKHPDIDPLNRKQFDPKLFELVRDRLLRNMYEGKRQSLAEVTDEIKSYYKPTPPVNVEKIKEDTVKEYKERQQLRNQGPIEQGKGETRQTVETHDELRKRTRRGDVTALDERLRAIGVLK